MTIEHQYTNVDIRGNNLLVRWANGSQQKIPFRPTLFVPTDGDSDWTNLRGHALKPIKFPDINGAKQWVKEYEGVNNFEFYGNTDWKQQFFLDASDKWVESAIKTLIIDIEVAATEGFPDIAEAKEEILLITVFNTQNQQITTWGRYSAEVETEYRCFEDETAMLKDFILWWGGGRHPDVVTGWNSEGFDVPYLLNRIERVLGTVYVQAMSPWKDVKTRYVKIMGKEVELKNLTGIAQLDYMDMYKKFIPEGRESFSLDFISEYELKERKTPHSYGSFQEFYEQDWQLFVEYNIQDVNLVRKLDHKLGLLTVVYSSCYLVKQNFQDVFSPVKTWDNYIHNQLWQKKIAIPQTQHRTKEAYQGAYVAEPKKGLIYNLASFDLDSMYPNIIIALNISPEKFGGVVDFSLEDYLKNPEPINSEYALAPNGAYFKKDSIGIMPLLVKGVYDTRVEAKTQMTALKRTKSKDKDLIATLDLQQKSAKLLLNSLYGALANEHFRYSNVAMAEAITLTGQLVIRMTNMRLNDWASKLLGVKTDVVIYNDTDSTYVNLEPLRKKFNLSPEKIVFVAHKVNEFLNKAATEVLEYISAFDTSRMNFKLEKIASRGLWTGKKKYALAVIYDEGVVYEEPEIKVTGLEVVRSSTPKDVRDWIKQGLRTILTKTEEDTQEFIASIRDHFDELSVEQVSFPRGVNNMEKWKDASSLYATGTPIHVRGSILYNHHITSKGLNKKYRQIYGGDKVKFTYLKMPNPIRENVIAYPDKLPEELDLHSYVDFNKQFESAFLQPLINILKTIGWEHEKTNSLEDLFL